MERTENTILNNNKVHQHLSWVRIKADCHKITELKQSSRAEHLTLHYGLVHAHLTLGYKHIDVAPVTVPVPDPFLSLISHQASAQWGMAWLSGCLSKWTSIVIFYFQYFLIRLFSSGHGSVLSLRWPAVQKDEWMERRKSYLKTFNVAHEHFWLSLKKDDIEPIFCLRFLRYLFPP